MTVLDDIVSRKRESIAQLSETVGLEALKSEAEKQVSLDYPFQNALSKPGLSLIAEVKKASPSKGIIRKDFEPVKIAKEFDAHGASCLSVLTEQRFFLGDPQYLTDISKAVSLPILRKDFIVSPIHVYEADCMGAQAILLIAAILTPKELKELHALAHSLGLSVLVELHDASELAHLEGVENLSIVGVNNRNLKTFHTSLETVLDLSLQLRNTGYEGLMVAESGYQTEDDLKQLSDHQIDAVLIGEGLALYPDLIQYFGGRHES